MKSQKGSISRMLSYFGIWKLGYILTFDSVTMVIEFSVLLPFLLLNSRGWPLGVLYSRTRHGCGGVVSLIVTSKEDRISI